MKIAASITPNKTKFGPLLFSEELNHGFCFLKENNYDGVEISLRESSDVDIKLLTELVKTNKLDIFAIATGQSFVEDNFSIYNGDQILRNKAVKRLYEHIDLANIFGAAVIVGGIRGKIVRTEFYDDYIKLGDEALKKCINYAIKKNVTILLEPVNRYETNIFNTIESVYTFIKKNHYENSVKILPDAYHMNIEEKNPTESLKKYIDYIGAFHCSDNNRLAPGLGHIDFNSLLSVIKENSEISYIGVEILPVPNSEEAAKTAIRKINKSI